MSGCEWIVEAYGCDPVRLGDVRALRTLFDAMVAEIGLHPVGEGLWHTFPEPGGVTGMLMLAESHLTVHTFPEHASLSLNLFCCTPRAEWAFADRLRTLVGADAVKVRRFSRDYGERPAGLDSESSPSTSASTSASAPASEAAWSRS